MKHGPIALIDEYRAVVCIATQSEIYEKMISNIQEILSRKGKVIAIATDGDQTTGGQLSFGLPNSSNRALGLLAALPPLHGR